VTGPADRPGGDRPAPLSAARDLVLGVLTGTVTAATDPWAYDEDLLLLAVRRLEQHDPDWLLARIADPALPFADRAELAGETRLLRERCRALLRAERPGDPDCPVPRTGGP